MRVWRSRGCKAGDRCSESAIPPYFEALLAACWNDGNGCGRHLFRDIKQRGLPWRAHPEAMHEDVLSGQT
ncbi:hypothetical protein CN085_24130 [Sinorhizobium meliloti]|nr:hypothetical protein CN085_24130 [Sinorhizobium meliloti]